MPNIWDEDYYSDQEMPARPLTQGSSEPGEEGYVSWLLEQISRPKHALWGAVEKGLEGGISGALEGAQRGWSLEDRYNLADVLGVPRPTSDMGWAKWLGLGAAHFASDVLDDPTNYIPLVAPLRAIGRGLRSVPGGRKVMGTLDAIPEAYYSSGLGKKFSPSLPENMELTGGVNTSDVMDLYRSVGRNMNQHQLDRFIKEQVQPQWDTAMQSAAAKLGRDVTPQEAMEAVERFGVRRPTGSAFDDWGESVPEAFHGLYEAAQPLLAMKNQARERLQAGANKVGAKPIKEISEVDINYVPQLSEYPNPGGWSGSLRNWVTGRKGDVQYNPTYHDPSRSIHLFEDTAGKRVALGDVMDPRTGVMMEEAAGATSKPRFFQNLGTWDEPIKGQELLKREASAVEKAELAPWREWNLDPIEALRRGITDDITKGNYYEILDELKKKGIIRESGQRMVGDPAVFQKERATTMRGVRDVDKAYNTTKGLKEDLQTGEDLSKWVSLKDVPGMEGYVTHPAVRNFLENKFMRPEDTFTKWRQGPVGSLLGDINRLWVNTTLPLHPAFHLGNMATNTIMQYLGGTKALDLAKRNLEGYRVVKGAGKEAIEGLPNQWLGNELMDRGMDLQGFYKQAQQAAKDSSAGYGTHIQSTADALRSPGAQEKLGETLSGALATGMEGIAKGAELGNRAHQWGYGIGNTIEQSQRTGMVVDMLKREHPDFVTYSPAQKAKVLDDVVRKSNEAMVDYTLTPFETNLRLFAPFYAWGKGAAKLAGHNVLHNTPRVTRFNAALNNFNEPISDKDRELFDSWLTNQNPVQSVLGNKDVLSSAAGPGVALLGRFSPFGDPEQMLKSPINYLGGKITPTLKAPIELLGNWNFNMGREIDPTPGVSGPMGLVNPLLDLVSNQNRPYALANRRTLGMQLPAQVDYAAGQLPGGRYLNQARILGNYLAGNLGGYVDPTRPEQAETLPTLVQLLTGAKAFPMKREQQVIQRVKEFKDEVQFLKHKLRQSAVRGDEEAIQFYQDRLDSLEGPRGL